MRLLCHPELPGSATEPDDPVPPGRGRRSRRGRRARDRARGPGPGVLRARPGRRGAIHRPAGGGGQRAGRPGPVAVPLPVRAQRPSRGGRGLHGCALLRPLAPARLPSAPAAHAPMGRRRALPRADQLDPGRTPGGHLPVELHRRLPRRDRGRPRCVAGLRGRGRARLVRVLLLLRRGRYLRHRSRRRGARPPRGRAAGRADRAPGLDHVGPTRPAHRAHRRGPRRRPRCGPHPSRGARDRRHRVDP